jgi:hypothetical protein
MLVSTHVESNLTLGFHCEHDPHTGPHHQDKEEIGEIPHKDLDKEDILDLCFNNELLQEHQQAYSFFHLNHIRPSYEFIPLPDDNFPTGEEHLDLLHHDPLQPPEDLDAHLKGYNKATPGFSLEGELDPYISFKGVDTDDPGGILTFYHYTFDPSLPRTIFIKEFTPSKPNLDKIKPYLGWAPTNIVGKTIENTTQYSRYVRHDDVLKMHFKSRFPAHNVK